MARGKSPDFENFDFRTLHPRVFMGTASDRYAGWIGQIYSKNRYEKKITRRAKKLGGQSFVEEVLPVESVEEYFQHFRVLELDFTFYRLLLEKDGSPTQNLRVLRSYRNYLDDKDRVILKVPQIVFAKKLQRAGDYLENEAYLNPEMFIRQFYEPAVKTLAPCLSGLIFEQEYQRKQDRTPPDEEAEALDTFFTAIPEDSRYHVELRTQAMLAKPVFCVLQKHGIGQVLSHWTWLPPLTRQFKLSGGRFFNSGGECIVRLMTPRGVRYEEAYARAHPFSVLVEGMVNQQMIKETADLMKTAIEKEVRVNVIINNRAGGNAPLIAQKVAMQFLAG